MIEHRAVAFRRIMAFAVDWLVILIWAGLLFGIVMVVSSGNPVRPSSPWVSQAIGFISMTLPVVLYFAISECSARQATLGKWILGLKVTNSHSLRPSLGGALARNAVKFIPWELGHIVANQAAFSGDAGIPIWVYGLMAVALICPLWWVVSIFSSGLAPYDRLSSTQVVRATRVPA